MTEITKNNSLEKVQEHLKAECFNKLFIGGHFVDPIVIGIGLKKGQLGLVT